MSKAADTTTNMVVEIIASIESGEGDGKWKRTWNISGLFPTNALTSRPYTGMNRFYLMLMGITYLATSKQWKQLGAAVQWDREPKPLPLSLLCPIIKTDTDSVTGKKTQNLIGFSGFNAYRETDQIGWVPPVVATLDFTPIEAADRLVAACGVTVIHGGDKAMYADSDGTVYMPWPERFDTVLEYYRTLIHEVVHWTSNKDRCNRRDDTRKKHGENSYAFEELIAEIGATFLSNELGLGQEELFRTNHIKYIKHWLDMMRGDSNVIVSAASRAEVAVKFLLKTLPEQKEVREAA